jgi:nucleotide-binding universal stress UspA family protein
MMIQIKRILIPTDFSETSKEALKYAMSMSKEYEAEMTVLNVVNEHIYTEGFNIPRVMSIQDLEKELCRQAETQMQEFLKDVRRLDEVKYKKVVIPGNPYLAILEYAKTNNVDLIVIGTHGRSGLEHMLFGSTAEKVIRKAPCPVLTVKPAQREFITP